MGSCEILKKIEGLYWVWILQLELKSTTSIDGSQYQFARVVMAKRGPQVPADLAGTGRPDWGKHSCEKPWVEP